MPKPLTTKDIASYCNVTQRAVVQWINTGKLKAFRTPGNHIRVDQKDFSKFLDDFDINLPEGVKSGQSSKRQKRILLIDQNPDSAASLRGMLNSQNAFEVDAAADGFDAGHKFGVFKPDMVLLSADLKDLDSLKICEKMRRLCDGEKSMKIVALVPENGNGAVHDILSYGADDYITMPFNEDQLLEKVMKHFGWTRRASDKR